MVTSNEFDSVKNILAETLRSYNYNETTINNLLSDNFINGLLELKEQEPEDNRLISILKNFSSEQSLTSLKELDEELRKELSCDSYVNGILNYINSSWLDISFVENTTVYTTNIDQEDDIDNVKIGISILAGIFNIISSNTHTGQKIIATEITIPLEIARRLHNRFENELIYADNFERQLKDIATGARGAFSTAHKQASPLALDLDGDGVETTTVESGVYFDHDDNGFAEKSGWVGKDDGLLVRDINNNGQIDDGTELFGNNSVLSSGQKAANGFEALADLDSNSDGVFNSSDTAWNQVKVWKDANSNGVVDDGELLTLEQANVSGINLDYENSTTTDENGNQHNQTGTFIKTDGTTGSIHDVWFDADYAA